MQDKFVECKSQEVQVLDKQHIVAFIDIIKDITSKIKAGEYDDYDSYSDKAYRIRVLKDGLVVSVSASHAVCSGFAPRPVCTNDHH